MKRSAVIVGAGIGGLTMAIRLAKQGFAVELLEARDEPGGRLGRVVKDGYTFDMGPTIVLMTDVFKRFFDELGLSMEDYLTFKRLDPNYRLHYADGSYMDSTSNLQGMLTEIHRLAPQDVRGFMRFLSYMYKRYEIARHDFIEQPMLSVKELFNPATLWKMMQLNTLSSMNRDIAKFIKDERVRLAMTFQSLYIGIDPAVAPSIYNVIGFMELSYSGVWYCEGGYHRVAQVFAQLAEELGVRISYRSRVKQVLKEGKRAVGVQLETGDIIKGDLVIVNADYPKAQKTLLATDSNRAAQEQKVKNSEQSCSTFMMYLGSKKRYPHAKVHNVYFSKDFRHNMKQVFESGEVPEHPSFYAHLPTLIDDSVAPKDRESIYILVPVANNRFGIDWTKQKSVLRDHILTRLEHAGFDGIRDAIETEHIITPEDWESDLSLEAGAAFGVLPKLSQSAYWRPSLKAKDTEGLYFIGASTHPGGGIPIVMTGAFALESVIKEDLPDAFSPLETMRGSSLSTATTLGS